MTTPLLSAEGLAKHFPMARGKNTVRAVDGVSFTIDAGETLGAGGRERLRESRRPGGSLLRLLEPTAGARERFEGEDLAGAVRRSAHAAAAAARPADRVPGPVSPRWTRG